MPAPGAPTRPRRRGSARRDPAQRRRAAALRCCRSRNWPWTNRLASNRSPGTSQLASQPAWTNDCPSASRRHRCLPGGHHGRVGLHRDHPRRQPRVVHRPRQRRGARSRSETERDGRHPHGTVRDGRCRYAVQDGWHPRAAVRHGRCRYATDRPVAGRYETCHDEADRPSAGCPTAGCPNAERPHPGGPHAGRSTPGRSNRPGANLGWPNLVLSSRPPPSSGRSSPPHSGRTAAANSRGAPRRIGIRQSATLRPAVPAVRLRYLRRHRRGHLWCCRKRCGHVRRWCRLGRPRGAEVSPSCCPWPDLADRQHCCPAGGHCPVAFDRRPPDSGHRRPAADRGRTERPVPSDRHQPPSGRTDRHPPHARTGPPCAGRSRPREPSVLQSLLRTGRPAS